MFNKPKLKQKYYAKNDKILLSMMLKQLLINQTINYKEDTSM